MNAIAKKFEKMGARVKVRQADSAITPRFNGSNTFRVDVRKDKEGTFFDLLVGKAVEVSVLDVQPKDRHLVLLARTPGTRTHDPDDKAKFLCGHDERDWFVAAVPENRPVSSVQTAKQALKPKAVVDAEAQAGVKPGKRQKRRNNARIRQGEWFFIPAPNVEVNENLILKNEPLVRGRVGKPHLAQYAYRTGGVTVYVGPGYPNGVTEATYKNMDTTKRALLRPMRRDARVYVKGTIRHSDHKTIHLDGWHLVEMNTETQSNAMRNVAFLD